MAAVDQAQPEQQPQAETTAEQVATGQPTQSQGQASHARAEAEAVVKHPVVQPEQVALALAQQAVQAVQVQRTQDQAAAVRFLGRAALAVPA